MSEYSQQFCISRTHPSLSGHFPGNPIVPGVIILDYVQLTLQHWQKAAYIKTFVQVKFLQPLAPEQSFTIFLKQVSTELCKFTCASETQKFVVGSFIFTEPR